MKTPFLQFWRYLQLAAVALIASCQCQPVMAQNAKTYIHPNVPALVPIYKQELENHFPDIPQPWYVLGLTEHESCLSLRHSRCWSPTSKFATQWKETNTPRELGVGLAMITKAWTKNGDIRMDTLGNLKKAYPSELKDLTWDNIDKRPDLQIRAMILLLRSDYRALSDIPDKIARMNMTDSSYNGGRSDLQKARKVCGLTKGCDPNQWFQHVENHCVKSKKALYGQRSPCDINTHHVADVFHLRMPKFQPILPQIEKTK